MLRGAVVLVIAAGAAACATQDPEASARQRDAGRCGSEPIFAAGGERATLWVRQSAEFRAASEATFRAAEAALARGLADPAWTAEPSQDGDISVLPPAVVLDIDETVLDNSEPQAEMLLAGTCFDEFPRVWDDWIAKRSAPAMPGAAAFVRAARAMRDPAGRPVRVFFVTNRECARRRNGESECPQQDDTQANLESLGLGGPTLADDLMLKGEHQEWESEKLSRRHAIASSYRIVLNVGDDLADFLPEVRRATLTAREAARCARADHWGSRWFLIPNPMYGSWLVALGDDLDSALAVGPAVPGDCPRS